MTGLRNQFDWNDSALWCPVVSPVFPDDGTNQLDCAGSRPRYLPSRTPAGRLGASRPSLAADQRAAARSRRRRSSSWASSQWPPQPPQESSSTRRWRLAKWRSSFTSPQRGQVRGWV
jgi:hypothetical protein